MTVLSLALAGNHPETVSLAGGAWNLLWVTLGNAVGGGIFVAGAYWVATNGFPGNVDVGDETAPEPAKPN